MCMSWEGFDMVLRRQGPGCYLGSNLDSATICLCVLELGCLPSLSFPFFICKMRVVIAPISSDCCVGE